MSLDFFIKKNNGNYELAIIEYEERKKSVNVSVENFINKYGYDLAIKKHKDRVEKGKNTFNNNPNKENINKINKIKGDYGAVILPKLDLFRIFNDFNADMRYPFIQYQVPDGQIIFKYYVNAKKSKIQKSSHVQRKS